MTASSCEPISSENNCCSFTGSRSNAAVVRDASLPLREASPAEHPALMLRPDGHIIVKTGGIYLARLHHTGNSTMLPALAVNGSPLHGALQGLRSQAGFAYQLLAIAPGNVISLLDLSAPLQDFLNAAQAGPEPGKAEWHLSLERIAD